MDGRLSPFDGLLRAPYGANKTIKKTTRPLLQPSTCQIGEPSRKRKEKGGQVKVRIVLLVGLQLHF